MEGQDADTRTDIFAFGTVVYEMVTGRKTFEGKSQASLIAAIMHVDPPALSTLQSITPPALDPLVKTCLAKDPDERWQSAGDLGRQMRTIREGGSQTDVPAVVAPGRTTRQWLSAAVAGGLLAAVVASLIVWTLTRPEVIPADVMRAVITLPDTAPVDATDGSGTLAVSPDGGQIVYTSVGPSGRQLYRRDMNQLDVQPLPDTEGASGPFFSPDGEWVGFWTGGGTLKKVPISGGQAETVAESPCGWWGASWGTDDQIIFGCPTDGGLFRVSADGGKPEALTTVQGGDLGHVFPFVIPGAHTVLFVPGPQAPLTTFGRLSVLDLVVPVKQIATYRVSVERG